MDLRDRETTAALGRSGWQADGLHPFGFWLMLTVLAGIAAIMFLLGRTAITAYRHAQIEGVAAVGSLFVEGILTPHAYEILEQPDTTEDLADEIGDVVKGLRSAQHFGAINIWSATGELRFNSHGYRNVEAHDTGGLQRAQAGGVAVALEVDDRSGDAPINSPYVEVYAPILSPSTNELVAVGEIYIDARDLIADRRRTEAAIWLSITLAALALAGLTGIVALQRRRLIERYAQLARSSAANLALLQRADAARTAAAQSNEALLNEVGAALHDGPLQMLTLAALGSETGDEPRRRLEGWSTMLQEAMRQLRQIAAGLILPEIGKLTASEAIRLAVARHQSLTGVKVDLTGGELPGDVPETVRTCLYRVAQEGLSNAFRHGGANARVAVRTSARNGNVLIEVENGPAVTAARSHPPVRQNAPRPRLGLESLRHRIGALGGTITLADRSDGGMVLRAELPVHFGDAAKPAS